MDPRMNSSFELLTKQSVVRFIQDGVIELRVELGRVHVATDQGLSIPVGVKVSSDIVRLVETVTGLLGVWQYSTLQVAEGAVGDRSTFAIVSTEAFPDGSVLKAFLVVIKDVPVRFTTFVARYSHERVESTKEGSVTGKEAGVVVHLLLQGNVDHGKIVHEGAPTNKDGLVRSVQSFEGRDPS